MGEAGIQAAADEAMTGTQPPAASSPQHAQPGSPPEPALIHPPEHPAQPPVLQLTPEAIPCEPGEEATTADSRAKPAGATSEQPVLT